MRITRFEDIEAWKKARSLTHELYSLTSQGDFAHDYGLRDQLRRASTSIMSNIAEGFERGGNKEFRQFLSLAKGSAGEVRSQLYIALDVGYLNNGDYQRLSNLVSEVSRLLSGFMHYLAATELKGNKLREYALEEYALEYEVPTGNGTADTTDIEL